MKSRRAAWVRSAVLLPAGAACTLPAHSQVLEEIVVTATKREERLQDVPLSVSAVSSEDIKARGFTQFADYINTIPGVFFQDGGPGRSLIRIRGITESGVGTTVATYFGETVTSVLTNQGGKPNIRLVDVERIEVLRGPQGTLFGADSLSGVLRFIPNAPDLQEFGVEVGTRGFTTAHSSDESYHVEGVVNIPLIENRLALRLVGYKDDIAGYIDNVVPDQAPVDYSVIADLLTGQDPGTTPPGTFVTPAINGFTRKDINSEDTWGARAVLRWQATDRLQFDLSYLKQDVTLNSEPFTAPAAGDYQQSRAMDTFEGGFFSETLDITSLVANYTWETMSLISASSYTEMERGRNQDITFLAATTLGAPIPWVLRDYSLGKLFTQEVRLQSTSENAFQWTLGAYLMRQDADLAQRVPDYSCPSCIPLAFLGQDYALDAPRQKFSDIEQQALFGEVSYDLSPQWTAGVGARYLEADIESSDPVADGLLAGGLTAGLNSGSTDELNPSAYVRFKPVADVTFYLQAARGFRNGTVNGPLPVQCQDEASGAGISNITDADSLWNYELGMKSLFAGGRLAINTAVYQQKWKDVQLGIALTCGFSGIVNGGDADGEGVELELVAQPTDAWRFNLSAAYNKNEFDSVQAGTGFVAGQRLPDAPEKNGSVGAQYNFGLGANWAGFARVDYSYVGNVLFNFVGQDPVVQESYNVTNARLGFLRDNLAVELFGRNLNDERGVNETGNPLQGGYQTLVRPREIGVELRYSFAPGKD